MGLFRKEKKPAPVTTYPLDRYEPVLRSSICTGEMTACMRDRETGKLHEVMLIRSPYDLAQFGKQYGVDIENIRTVS